MYRLPQNELRYLKYLEGDKGCYFCNPEPKIIVDKLNNFYIMKNNFPYDIWDSQKVKKHLLIVSKEHLSNLSSKDKNLLSEYSYLINKYLKQGYDIFTRSTKSASRSQAHFHTHLIKTSGKTVTSLNFNSKPYKLTIKTS